MFICGAQIHKVLVVFALSSSKLVFYYMWVVSFKVISKHCSNFIQKACVMVEVIRTKTQSIMLEATIWSQVVNNQGM